MSELKPDIELLLSDHKELCAQVHELREYLEQPRPSIEEPTAPDWAAHLSRQLLALHTGLAAHFRAEDELGVMDELALRFPRATRRLDELKGEHRQILSDLAAILAATMSYSQGTEPPNPRLRQWTQSLLEQLVKHEADETELMQKLFTDEVGVGD